MEREIKDTRQRRKKQISNILVETYFMNKGEMSKVYVMKEFSEN